MAASSLLAASVPNTLHTGPDLTSVQRKLTEKREWEKREQKMVLKQWPSAILHREFWEMFIAIFLALGNIEQTR